MSETKNRIITSAVLLAVLGLVILAECNGIHIAKYVAVLVVLGMIAEFVQTIAKQTKANSQKNKNKIVYGVFLAWLVTMLFAAYNATPKILLTLVVVISVADVCGWLFGRMIGGDKMWERLSTHKTWSGQIAGVIGATIASILIGKILWGHFYAVDIYVWQGISIALLSQYGDLTASWIKRRIGIKDFGTILPGHGGLLDRFDGWLYILPLFWIIRAIVF